MEEVECAECGNRYDSATQPFCARCGSESKRRGGRVAPVAWDPRRRRARIGGIVLATMGLFALIQAGISAVAPAGLDEEQLEALADVELIRSQPGGDLHLYIVDNGTAVDNATVALSSMRGTAIANLTTSGGWANATALEVAFGNITVTSGNMTVQYSFYVPTGEVLVGEIDIQDEGGWVAIDQVQATRIIAGFLAFFAAFVVVGGVAAFRLKWWRIAIAAAILAAVPGTILLFVVPLAGVFLLLPTGLALVFIAQGKRGFT